MAPYAQQSRQTSGAREVPLPVILSIEDDRASTRADLDVLLAAMRGPLAGRAIQALGRLERRDVITDLLPYLSGETTRAAAATAVGLALRGPELDGVLHGQQERAVLDALLAAGDLDMAVLEPAALTSITRALGRLPYEDVDSFKAAETFLRKVLEKPFPRLADAPHVGAARGLESLARLSRKVASLDDETIERLRFVARTLDPRRSNQQRNALQALIAAQGVDADTLEVVLAREDAEVRRLAVLALSGSGSSILDEERIGYIRRALSDTSYMVRLEAVRAWTRRGVKEHGCQPLLDALSDPSLHVVLGALDALGDVCRDDAAITTRIASEARTPRPQGRWQREMHAFVALAKRDRERAAISMLTFAMHTTWQVRMYTARAAAIVDDVPVLGRLASDPENNVAEAALTPLRRLIGADSDALFVEALNRRTRNVLRNQVRPYEVIRTAALALDKAAPTPALVGALAGALERITAEQCETSRDTRLALIDRLAQLGSPAQVSTLTPLLKDFDPKVAKAAAEVVTRWTGKVAEIDTPHQKSTNIPTVDDLAKLVRVSFEMDNGRRFDIQLDAARRAAGAHEVSGGGASRVLQQPDVPPRRAELRHSGRQSRRERVLRGLPLHARRSGPHARTRDDRHLDARARYGRRADLHQPRRQPPPGLRLHRLRARLLRDERRRRDRRGRPDRPGLHPAAHRKLRRLGAYQILTISSAVPHGRDRSGSVW